MGETRLDSERRRKNEAKAMKWNEVFDLPRTGQVFTGRVSDLMSSLWKNGHHQLHWAFITATHNGKGRQQLVVSYIFICHTTIPFLSIPLMYEYFPLFSLNSWTTTLKNLTKVYTLCPKVSLTCTWFYSGPLLYLQMPEHFSFPFILIDAVATVERHPPADGQIRASEMKTFPPLLDDNCMWLCSSSLPMGLWSWQHATAFDSWGTLTVCRPAKGPPVSEVRSEETGAWKAGVQLGEDQKRHKL